MCECLCGDIKEDIVLQIGTTTIVVDAYLGCEECSQLVGIDVHAFTPGGATQWVDSTPKEIVPDEYGVLPTAASFELFSIEDLASAAEDCPAFDDYENPAEWLRGNGLRLLQAAFRRCRLRIKDEAGKHANN